jgi:hypothetical protein
VKKFVALFLLISFEVHASSIDMSKYYLDDETIVSSASKLLFATHLSTEWDSFKASSEGANRTIAKAKERKFEISYLVPWAFEDVNGNEQEFDRLLALYKKSRSEFILEITPTLERKMGTYFLPEISPNKFIGSFSGELYELTLQAPTEIVFVGGFLSACLQATISNVALAADLSSSSEVILKIVEDGVYVNGCDNSTTPMTLAQCKVKSPTTYENYLRTIKSFETSKVKTETLSSFDF